MKLEFQYTREFEVQRVKQTIKNKEVFEKFGYKLFFPDGFDLNSKSFTKLKKHVDQEFDIEKIDIIEKKIKDDWKLNEKEINKLLNSVPYIAPNSLLVIFTQYGVGGSYWVPNRVIINVNYFWLDYFESIMHELVHLLIEEPIIQKYKIKFESKEALIDYIMSNNKYLKKMFPEYKIQKDFISHLPDKEFLKKVNLI